jgi:streptogramin lyase
LQLGSGELVEVASDGRRVIKRFPVTDPQALAVGDGAIWIAHVITGTVTRVDPANGHTTATIHLALPRPLIEHTPSGIRRDRQFLPSAISFGAGEVWVSTARGWIAVIDPRTGRLAATVPSPSEDNATIAASHGTWVAEDGGGVGFIPHGTGQLAIHPIFEHGQSLDISELVTGGGRIWAAGSYFYTYPGERDISSVTAIDPANGRTEHQLQIPGDAGIGSIVYGNGGLYVDDFDSGLLLRIAPDYTVQSLRSVRGPATQLVGTTPGALWATTDSGPLLRITLPDR